jgi:hypothetical protein
MYTALDLKTGKMKRKTVQDHTGVELTGPPGHIVRTEPAGKRLMS